MSAHNLGKRFGPRWLFRHLEIELNAGDCLVVRGNNGSGKSTLLRVIAGLTEPSEGSVLNTAELGFSSIELAVYPELTGAEHLELSSSLRGCPTRIDELLQLVGIPESANRPTKQYSTGMKTRLKLAMAIQHRPFLLILDEPAASLDGSGREVLSAIVRQHLQHGVAVIATNEGFESEFATHQLMVGR